MKHTVQLVSGVVFVLSLQLASASGAIDENGPVEASSPEEHFARGRFEGALTSGVLFSPFIATHNRPTINYTVSSVQLGYMLSDVKGDRWWRGNFELAGEAFGSAVFEGAGDYIAGGTLWLRYNLVPRNSARLVPFAQAGAGMVDADVDRNVLGQEFNFNLGVSFGLRYFISRNCSLSLEYRYQHISNANLSNRNLGINAAGPVLGISYFF